jgi:hypothetical protein
MAQRDRPLLELLQRFLGRGSINDSAPAQPGWQAESTFRIHSQIAHHQVTIPFADTFLFGCEKRHQFELWRDAFYAYEAMHPNRYGQGRSVCSAPGCDKPVRGRGLCRSHYYRETGY